MTWDDRWIEHQPDTSAPGDYDTSGNYWCATCTEHRELMDLGKLLDWPEIFYFPDNPPELQLTMVREGADNWRKYVRGRGHDAVHTVLDRAHYEQRKSESRNEPDVTKYTALQSELLAVGQSIAYRQVILGSSWGGICIGLGLAGWTRYAFTETEHLSVVVQAVRTYAGHIIDVGLAQ